MVEKICKVINGEYCCDIDITIDEWKQLLTNPKITPREILQFTETEFYL